MRTDGADRAYTRENERRSYAFLAELLLHHPDKCEMDQIDRLAEEGVPKLEEAIASLPDPEPLPPLDDNEPVYPTVRRIINVVSHLTGVPRVDIVSPRRLGKLVYARHIVMWLARRHTPMSLPQIGEKLGGRDHTTIFHGIRKMETRRHNDPMLSDVIRRAEKMLGVIGD